MAKEFPQIQESQPIIQTQTASSHAEGYEAFAKSLASIGAKAEEMTESIVTEQSQAMYLQSVANAEQLKNQSNIDMLEHPDMAPKIAKDTNYTLDTIKKAAFVNDKDRSRLSFYISGISGDIKYKAAVTEIKQRQNEALFTHYTNWPDQLEAYKQALLTDHDKADQLKQAMIGTLHGFVTTGVMTPHQASGGIEAIKQMVEIANDHYQEYGNPNSSAKNFHTITSNPLNPNQPANPNSPVNESTSWMTNYYNTDRTFQGALSDVYSRMKPNPRVFDNLNSNQRKHLIMATRGVQEADGLINSGEPFPSIEKTYQQLSEKGTVLSYKDDAKKNALGKYLTQLKNGNYLDVMAKTPIGNAIMSDFVAKDSAIKNLALTNEEKTQLMLQNKNDLVTKMASLGDGSHTPREYVQPIAQADVAAVQNGFKLGQNPSSVLTVIGQYNKQNQAYLANAMKNPTQRLAVQALSFSDFTISPEEKLDFVASLQDGRKDISTKVGAETKDKELLNRIYTNLTPSIAVLGKTYDFENAQILQNSMLQSTLKYAKYLAQKDNNLLMEEKEFSLNIFSDAQWKKYIDQASKIYSSSFQQVSGTNYIVNPQQLPQPLSKPQLDNLANYAVSQGYKYLREGRKDYEYENARSRNPLRMIISPTNDIQAVDGNGSVYFSVPFTSNLIPHTEKFKKDIEAEERRARVEQIERNERQRLNVRLPDANATK